MCRDTESGYLLAIWSTFPHNQEDALWLSKLLSNVQGRALLEEGNRTSEKGSGKGLWNSGSWTTITCRGVFHAEFDWFQEGHATLVAKGLNTFTAFHMATPNTSAPSRPLIHRKVILRTTRETDWPPQPCWRITRHHRWGREPGWSKQWCH